MAETESPDRRGRLRVLTVEEIKATARLQLAQVGSSSVNLRAIARQMQIAPSALYRYFASRDDILTALITDAYNDLGEVVEASVTSLDPDDGVSRFLTAAGALRTWAKSNPNEFGLLYGSPVPGYTAPETTKPPSMRTPAVLLSALQACLRSGTVQIAFGSGEIPADLASVLSRAPLHESPDGGDPGVAAAAMIGWTALVGYLVCEVFSHWPPEMAAGAEEFFDFTMRRLLLSVGADPARTAAGRRLAIHPG